MIKHNRFSRNHRLYESKEDFVINNGVLTKYKGSGEKVSIPDGVKEIGKGVFAFYFNLKSVTIPNSVEK